MGRAHRFFKLHIFTETRLPSLGNDRCVARSPCLPNALIAIHLCPLQRARIHNKERRKNRPRCKKWRLHHRPRTESDQHAGAAAEISQVLDQMGWPGRRCSNIFAIRRDVVPRHTIVIVALIVTVCFAYRKCFLVIADTVVAASFCQEKRFRRWESTGSFFCLGVVASS